MKAVMYIFVNTELGMSVGKTAAQASHAAVKAYQMTVQRERIWDQGFANIEEHWDSTGHTKLVMAARDEAHLRNIKDYLMQHGFASHLVIDEGRTEIEPYTATALGVEIVDKDNEAVQFAFGDFRTLKPPKDDLAFLEDTFLLKHLVRWSMKD